MKFLNFEKVLCISPHPDDVELGMLGSILKYRDTVFDILCLTICGAKGFDNSDKLNRLDEIKSLWENSRCPNVKLLYADCDYFEDKSEPGWINYIENNFVQKTHYDCIFIPPNKDSMFEHRFVNGFGYALIRHMPISLIEYHTTSTLNTWRPNLFINIDDHFYRRMELLKFFKSQYHKGYFSDSALIAKSINFQYSKKGITFIEKYNIKEIIN